MLEKIKSNNSATCLLLERDDDIWETSFLSVPGFCHFSQVATTKRCVFAIKQMSLWQLRVESAKNSVKKQHIKREEEKHNLSRRRKMPDKIPEMDWQTSLSENLITKQQFRQTGKEHTLVNSGKYGKHAKYGKTLTDERWDEKGGRGNKRWSTNENFN